MSRRSFPLVALLVLLTTLAGTAQARTPWPERGPVALLRVDVPTAEALARFQGTHLPAYTRPVEGFLLTGADAAGREPLLQAGLSFRILDPDIAAMLTGRSAERLYLAYATPGRPAPDWPAYGRLLLEEGGQVLLRATPAAAERLALAGVELRALTFDPKPLQLAAAQPFPAAITPDPLIQAMIDQVTQAIVYQYTGGLSGEWPVNIGGSPYTITTRNTYSGTPIQKATQYVGEHLTDLGLAVEYHQWGGASYPNVIGTFTGTLNPEDIFLIGAHLDDMPSYGNAPGADDNASGSVATLIAADILTQYQWGCTLKFAFWTGEEQGLLGSAAYAQRAYSRGENILGYLNLDMIAWNTGGSSPGIDLHADSSIPPTLQLAQLFADVVDAYNLNLIPQIIPNGTGASDHASFWDYGYTAILGIEDMGDFNPYYHTSSDDMDNFQDWPYYVEFVKAAIGTYAHMSGCLIPDGIGHLEGHVTAAQGGAPIGGATVYMEDTAGRIFSDSTDSGGYYTRTLLAGTYVVTATAYGYLPASVGGVVVVTDTVTTQDFALQTAPTYIVSGTVSEAGTGLPLFARIAFDGSPVVVWTDPANGFYQATLPQGSYTMHVTADLHQPAQRAIVLDHDQTQDFTLDPLPCILLVDDDGDGPDVRSYYTTALDNLDYDYNVWNVLTQGDPGAGDLWGYRAVIWFTGYPYQNTFTPDNEAAVAAYLDDGGNFLLSSQDYLWEFHLTPFGQNYLHIGSYTSDVDQTTVTGAGPYAGLGPYSLSYPFNNYSDRVNPDGQSVLAFSGDQGNAAVAYEGAFHSVFLGFPFEAIPALASRSAVLEATVEWFGGCQRQEGWLVGQVSDAASGLPLAGAQVTVVPGWFVNVPTDPTGRYTLTLSAGTYDVTAEMSGYYPQTVQGVQVQTGLTTTQDFALLPVVTTPTVVLSPGAFSVTLAMGRQHTATLSVGNVGSAPLHYTLTEVPAVAWLEEDPPGGAVDPGSSAPVAVSFDAAGLEPGPYCTTLQVQSNDPEHPLVPVPVTLTVVLTPCQAVHDADFAWVPPEPLAGQTITFTGTAVGDEPIAYTWKLEVGSWKEGQVVTYSYALPGLYTVWLTATNCGTAVATHTESILVACEEVTGTGFTWDPPQPGVGQSVAFHGTAGGTLPISFTWDFGDGGTAGGAEVQHTFTAAGTYTVTLTATNPCSQQTIAQAVAVVPGSYEIYLPLVWR